jgi:hypothetical protein
MLQMPLPFGAAIGTCAANTTAEPSRAVPADEGSSIVYATKNLFKWMLKHCPPQKLLPVLSVASTASLQLAAGHLSTAAVLMHVQTSSSAKLLITCSGRL